MYAIVELGGRQWKVETGSRLDINRLPLEVGATHAVDRVLLAHDGAQLQVGRPYLEGAKVLCEVVEHRLGPKTISYHYRRRENWRKTVGHRQPLTRLVVKEVVMAGAVPDVAAETSAPKDTTKRSPTKAPTVRRKPSLSTSRPSAKESGHGA